MTPDEKEQQLRDAVMWAVEHWAVAKGAKRQAAASKKLHAALDAYVEFVRLRSVAEAFGRLPALGDRDEVTYAYKKAQAALDALLKEG